MKRKHNLKIPCLCLLFSLVGLPIFSRGKVSTGLILNSKKESVFGVVMMLKTYVFAPVIDLDWNISLRIPILGNTHIY